MLVKCGKLQKNVGNMWITAPKMWECGKHVENMWETCGKLICMYKCAKLSPTIQT